MEEFLLVDRAAAMFEGASGCKLHRDPAVGKCKFLPLGRWKGTLQQEDIPCNYMLLSDHLDMVGVILKATHTQTRKANGDEIQSRVKNTIGPWQAGKFMALTQRPWSANCYALSKVWFRCYSIDLRLLDVNAINSKVKSWLYADQLVKPEEKVLFRPVNYGGLGLLSVQIRAQACLYKSFLETAANPHFQQNLYHAALFKYYVQGDRTLPDPGLPPYYPASFFSTLCKVSQDTPLNIVNMSLKQWYQLLLEDNVTMSEVGNSMEYIPCRVELQHPTTDWEITWKRSRLSGLGSELASFLFRLLHDLLPTRERQNRIFPATVNICRLCQSNSVEDLPHSFFYCSFNREFGMAIVQTLLNTDASMTPEKLLRLEMNIDDDDMELPTVWYVAAKLLHIWNCRVNGRRAKLYTTRAEVESRVNLLRETRFRAAADKISEIINSEN